MLGCGEYEVELRSRGGSSVLGVLNPQELSWGRRLNDVSQARFSAPPCDPCVSIRTWEHEVHILRDGVPQWIGVPAFMSTTDDQVTIEARDLAYWLDHRLLNYDHGYEQEDLSVILSGIVEDAMSRDSVPGVFVSAETTGIVLTRQMRATDRRNAGEEIRALGSAGMVFTMILRELRAGGPDMPLPFGGLDDEHLDAQSMSLLGVVAATEAFVLGATDKIEGIAGGISPTLGLVQSVLTGQSRILDDIAATDLAQQVVDNLTDPPLSFQATLKQDSPHPLEAYLPGRALALRTVVGCEDVDAPMRLTELDVRVPAEAPEQVSVTLVSA